MGLQLVFVVETNKKCNSDWIYIKDTIEHFYSYERTQIKFSVVYMEGKWTYDKKEKQINSFISQYKAMSESNKSKVIFCFDCDDYDINQGDADFLKKAKNTVIVMDMILCGFARMWREYTWEIRLMTVKRRR